MKKYLWLTAVFAVAVFAGIAATKQKTTVLEEIHPPAFAGADEERQNAPVFVGIVAPPQAPPASSKPAAPREKTAPVHPCAQDTVKFCPGAKNFREQMRCLYGNIESVKAACGSHLQKLKAAKQRLQAGCRKDFTELCPPARKSPVCLMRNEAKLSAACGKGLENWKKALGIDPALLLGSKPDRGTLQEN